MLSILCLTACLAHPAHASALPGDFVRSLTFLACGDANGDGIGDFAIGLPRDDAHGENAGRVFVLSGKDASVIRELHAGGAHAGFGFALAAGGDFDGDGKRDLVVAGHRDGFPLHFPERLEASPPRLYVFTLATGELRKTIEADNESLRSCWASAIHTIGDVDEDGALDLLVESREEADVSGGYRSPTTILSGKTGKTWGRLDFDAGHAPILLGSFGVPGERAMACIADGRARISGSLTGEPWTLRTDSLDGVLLRTLVDLGDMDRDGYEETAALGVADPAERCENVRVVSLGRIAKPWFEVRGDDLRKAAGIEAESSGRTLDVCAIPDLDGDGCKELFVMLPGAYRSMTRPEWAAVHPGSEMPLGMETRGFAAAISSKTGRCIWTALGTIREPLGMTIFEYGFGEEVRQVPDLEQDGLDDVGVAACYASTSEPYERTGARLSILSSKSGGLVMTIDFNSGAEPRVQRLARAPESIKPK